MRFKILRNIICISLLIVSFGFAEEKTIGPKIETNVRIIDFEGVKTTDVPDILRHIGFVEVKNTGDKDLHINKIETDCECLKAEISKNIILPQDKAILNISVKPASIGEERIEKMIKIYSDDTENPEKTIIVRVKFKISPELEAKMKKTEQVEEILPSPWELNESRIFFGFVKKGKEETRKVTLSHKDKKEFKITKIENKIKSIKVKINSVEKHKKYEIEITWQPKKNEKHILGDIILNTDLSDVEPVIISVLGHVE